MDRKAGKLSGGQQAQLALTLALARRPRLLVLDEPMSSLDPLARHDFMATVMTAMADDGVSVVLSSHVLAELERVADYFVLLSGGSVQVAGEVDDLLACHRVLTGPAAEADRYAERLGVVHARRGEAQAHLLIRTNGSSDPGAAGLGGASGQPRRTRPGLPARARRRVAARTDARRAGRTDGGRTLTALSLPAPPGRDARPRPVPWRRMAWVTWRQHRLTLAGLVVVLGAASVYLYITGEQLRDQGFVSYGAGPGLTLTAALFQVIPPLIGAFVGAPVLARELETGTFRFTWTQGFGRARWTVATLAPLALAVTVVAGAFGFLFSWCYGPQIGGKYGLSPLAATTFDLHDGRLRRLDAGRLRDRRPGRHADPPGRPRHVRHPRGVERARRRDRGVPAPPLRGAVGDAQIHLALHRLGDEPEVDPSRSASQLFHHQSDSAASRYEGDRVWPFAVASNSPLGHMHMSPPQYLLHHGFTQVSSYQPASRFWPFQWIEGGWLLGLSLLLMAVAVWLVHRRAA